MSDIFCFGVGFPSLSWPIRLSDQVIFDDQLEQVSMYFLEDLDLYDLNELKLRKALLKKYEYSLVA